MKKCLALLCGVLLLAAAFPALAQDAAAEQAAAQKAAENAYTVGNTVIFGRWEQDNDKANGAEPIEWTVLAVDGGKALLISKYGLDARPYDDYTRKITWCRSSLRRWLNYTFYSGAFTVEERERILETAVANPGVEEFSSYGCGDTNDFIFLLSYSEAFSYFQSDEARQVKPTAYASANGAYTDETAGTGWWWLRSMGADNTSACGVKTDGRVSGYGSLDVYRKTGSVRPVIWLYIGD